jgi:hypothetical protein
VLKDGTLGMLTRHSHHYRGRVLVVFVFKDVEGAGEGIVCICLTFLKI